VEEEIALLPWNLEADEAEGCSQSEGLLAFAADDCCPEFHKSPPALPAPLDQLAYNEFIQSKLCAALDFQSYGPYLRYRKWRAKDDNSSERLEAVERPWRLTRLVARLITGIVGSGAVVRGWASLGTAMP
jgi:hypothetical protein